MASRPTGSTLLLRSFVPDAAADGCATHCPDSATTCQDGTRHCANTGARCGVLFTWGNTCATPETHEHGQTEGGQCRAE